MIPKVAASEMGASLNPLCVIACERCIEGVVGLTGVDHSQFKELQN